MLDSQPAELDERDFEIFNLLAELIAFELEADEDRRRRQAEEEERRAFVDAVAHDLKNPLGAIQAQAQLLQRWLRRAGTVSPETLEKGLDRIEGATGRAVGLINEMLDAAHLHTGRPLELRPQPTDLIGLVLASAEACQWVTISHAVHVDVTDEALVGLWDRSRLERVLDNLLANATKFSPNGGEITVRVGRVDDAEGQWAVLTVMDQGIGIPASDLPHVFQPFRRGANVTGRIAGTGIGLAGAKQIVDQHGGTIEVESEEGVGSTFTVRLPLPTDCEASSE